MRVLYVVVYTIIVLNRIKYILCYYLNLSVGESHNIFHVNIDIYTYTLY